AAKPDVELWIRFLGGDLCHRFAGTLERQSDLDAGLALELGGDAIAPFRLNRADDIELLRRRANSDAGDEAGESKNGDTMRDHSTILRWVGSAGCRQLDQSHNPVG